MAVTWREGEEVDYDPFAEAPAAEASAAPPVESAPAEPAPAQPAPAQPAPAEPAAAEPETLVVPSRDRYKLPKVVREEDQPKKITGWREGEETDVDPFAEAPPPEPKKEPDSWVDPKDYALVRGGAEGLRSIKGGAEVLDVLDLSFGDMDEKAKLAKILAQEPAQGPDEWARREPSIGGVRSLGEFVTWFQESAGSGVVSTMPSVIGGAVGAAGGTALGGPVGAAIGAAGGAALPSMALGISGMYDDLRQNEGVRKALQDGTLTVDQFQKLTLVGGVLSGALDAIPAAKWGGKALGIQAAKDAIRETFVKAAIKGAFEEGGTEGLQQVVSEAAQSTGGGNTSLGQAAMNIIDASLQGMVGGMIFGGATRERAPGEANKGAEEPPKADDQPDTAAPVQPEGTPAAATPATGQPTPGDTGATEAPPPAGTEQQPEPAKPAVNVPGTDPRTAAKPPQPAPAPAPGVTVVTPGTVPADVATALSTATGAPAAATATPSAEEVELAPAPGEAPEVAARETEKADLIRKMFRQQAEQQAADRAEQAASQAQQAQVSGRDLATEAALNAAATPNVPTPSPPIGGAGVETLGTGRALTQPAETATVGGPAAPPLETAAGPGPGPVAGAAAPQAPTALAPVAAQQLKEQPLPAAAEAPVSPAPTVGGQVATPALLDVAQPAQVQRLRDLGYTPEDLAGMDARTGVDILQKRIPKDVAAFTPAVPTAEPAPAQAAAQPVAVEEAARAPVAEPLPPKAAKAVEVSVKKRRGVAKEAPTEAKAKKAPAPQPEAKPEPAKAAAAKEVETKRVTREQIAAEEKQKAEALAKEVEERKAKEAARPRLARDIHAEARGEVDRALRGPKYETVERGDIEQMLTEESDTAAAEARKDASPAERIREAVPKIVERIKARLAEREKAEMAAFVSEEEKQAALAKSAAEERKAEAKRKQEEQAKAETGQKKERAGKEKGKSAAGIRTEAHDSIVRRIEKMEEKPEQIPEAEKPLLREQKALFDQRKGIVPGQTAKVKVSPAQKADIDARIAALQEQRAQLAEAREAEEAEKLSPRARDVEATVKEAAATVPRPPITGGHIAKTATGQNFMKGFYETVRDALKKKGQELAHHIDTVHNSVDENLAIYARKLLNGQNGESNPDGHGIAEFYTAHMLAEAGDTDNLYNLITTERLLGSRGEGGAPDISVDVSRLREDTDVMKSKVRSDSLMEEPVTDITGEIQQKPRDMNAAFDNILGANRKSVHPIEVETPDGRRGTVRGRTLTGSEALAEVGRMAGKQGGFIGILRQHLIKHLSRLVGDIDVHIVSEEDMRRLAGPKATGTPEGLYFHYAAEQRAAGARPMVFVSDTAELSPQKYMHTMLHEMTHAATSQALTENIRGTAKIFSRMQSELRNQLLNTRYGENELRRQGLWYALAHPDPAEFVAEAFSNPAFQQILAETALPRRLQMSVAGLAKGRLATFWDAAVAAVSNAVGMLSGQRGNTYMDGVMRLFPELARSTEEQRAAATETMQRPLPGPYATGTADIQQLTAEFGNIVDGVKSSITDHMTPFKRRVRDMLSTTGELRRRFERLTGQVNTGFDKLAELFLKKDAMRGKIRAIGQATEYALAKHRAADKAEHAKLSNFLHESSRFGVDGRVGLNDAANNHVDKTGHAHEHMRNAITELNKDWQALTQESRDLANEAIAHYEKMHDLETQATISAAVKSAMRKYRQALPAGEDMNSIIQWVSSGEAARDVAHQTQRDKDLHAALGNTAQTLAAITHLRKLSGIYVPLSRRGRWFITAREKLTTPTGGFLDPTAPDNNRFLFQDEAAFKNYLKSNPEARGHTTYIDPNTGQRISALEPHAVKMFVATVQNKRLEMHDSKSTLERRRKELAAAGHEVSEVALTEKMLESGAHEVSTLQLQRILANLEQTMTGHNTIGQAAMKNAVIDAHIRSMARPSALTHKLKRKGTLGYDLDLVGAMGDYNRHASSHIANMQLADDMATADDQLAKYIESQRKRGYGAAGPSVHVLQLMRDELHARINNTNYVKGETWKGRLANVLMDVSFMRHLFSPHYTIMQMLQPAMVTYPVLAAKYGHGAAWREIVRAYRIGGFRKTLGKGFSETWANKNINPYKVARVAPEELSGRGVHDQMWYDLVAGEPDAADLQDMMTGVTDQGLGAASGIEAAALSEQDLSKAEIVVNRLTNVAKALPESAEGINRYTTAIATYRLARRNGMGHEAAKREAILSVEETQGGYGRANNPLLFSNPLLRFPLQFRKYSVMYGQLFYGNLARLLSFKTDRATRVQAGKSMVRLSAMTALFAGVGGLPFAEMMRAMLMGAQLTGLSDDDWEDWETGMQKWFASLVGDDWSEAIMHGLPRMLGVDMSGSLGADNLLTFGQPKTMEEKDVSVWLKNMVLGAGGKMAEDMYTSLKEGDFAGAIPWPKVIENFRDAYKLATEGTRNKETGEKYAEPIGKVEAAWQALGFKPASVAEQFEAKGSGRQAQEKRQLSHDRTTLMGRWSNADTADAQEIFRTDVAEWNRTHTGKERISYSDLVRSKRERARQKRERKHERETQ